MEFKWHFSDESCQSNRSVDKFADSKFSIDRWTSFSREIIQNSLDARDDQDQPVEVVFDLNKTLTLDDIPGGRFTKSVLEKCAETAANKQTKQDDCSYERPSCYYVTCSPPPSERRRNRSAPKACFPCRSGRSCSWRGRSGGAAANAR